MTLNQTTPRPGFSRRRAVGLSLSLLAAAAGAGFGQDATPSATGAKPPADADIVQLDTFEVMGVRGSVTKALDVKRSQFQMVDSIVAEDIGKFPDNNVVESMQRLSGVQVTNRGAGEIGTVTIRGLTDVTTTVNGRNIFTASGSSVALADIPASLLRGVDVYKTRSADLLENGIGGVIDIHTQRPFDFKGDRVVLAARGIYQEQSDKFDPNLSALVSKRWTRGDQKFGALLNVSFAQTHYRDQSVTPGAQVPFLTGTAPDSSAGSWVPYERIFLTKTGVSENPIWSPGLENGLSTTPGSTVTMNGVAVPYVLSRDAIFQSDYTGLRKRPAANLSLQYSPNEKSEYVMEVFYNGYRNTSENSLLFSFVDWWGGPLGNVNLYPATNIVKSRDLVSYPYAFSSGDVTKSKTDSFVYALGGKWDISDALKLKADLSYQTSRYKSDFFAMRVERVFDQVVVDFNEKDGLPAWSFGNDQSALLDPSKWTIAQLYDNSNRNKGSAYTGSVDGEYKLDWTLLTTLKFGARYDVREASEAQRTSPDPAPWLGQALTNFPGLWTSNSDFFDGRANIPSSWLVPDGDYLLANADKLRAAYGLPTSGSLKLVESFNVEETNTALYGMANFSTQVAGRTLDGQFGGRFVNVETDMTGTNLTTLAKTNSSASKSKLLPSMMIRYSLRDNLLVRASYGETLRRPAFTSLNPNIIYNADVTNIGYGTASGGNPDLKPTTSKNYDLGVEWYFAKSSALYGSLFKREIDGIIIDFRRRTTHNGNTYIVSQPYNASKGELQGVELGGVYFPDNVPDFLRGIGIQASYTLLDSEQDVPVTDSEGNIINVVKRDMFGVSDSSYSVVLAYERGRFGGRLSYTWREAFLNNYEAASFANPLGIYRRPEESLDFQLSYKVTDDFTLTFDATNLTNSLYQSYYGENGETTNNFGNSLYSRTFAVGARYSF